MTMLLRDAFLLDPTPGLHADAQVAGLDQQFLADGSNTRTDLYGGTRRNRTRFVVEVASALAQVIGAHKVGIRISPASSFNDIQETETAQTCTELLEGLSPLGLLYLHILEGPDTDFHEQLRELWDGTIIFNTGLTRPSDLATAQQALDIARSRPPC